MTIRLLALYQGNPPNTIVTLATGTENALVAAGNATTDLSGGVPPAFTVAPPVQVGDVLYGADGVPLGIADPTGKLIFPFTGIAAPGAPTGLTLTPIAGGVLAAFTPSATLGGTATTGFEVTLSNGRVQRGAASPIFVSSPAGAVTATVKQINGAGLSAASAASASATVPAYSAPAAPGAPTNVTLTAGNGKVTATWAAAPANGSALRNNVVTLSNGATAVAAGGATTVDITTPNGIAVTATVRATNGEGQGPVSAVSGSVTPTSSSNLLPLHSLIAQEGDSITAQEAWTESALYEYGGAQYMYPYQGNQALSGTTTTQQLAAADVNAVVSKNAAVITLLTGTNDIALTSNTPTQIFNNIQSLINQHCANGVCKKYLCIKILPRNDATFTGLTPQRQADLALTNALLDNLVAPNGVDLRVITITGFDPATDTADGLHPNYAGARKIGSIAGPVLSGWINQADLRPFYADASNLIVAAGLNAAFTGTGGTKSGGITGTVADNWTASMAADGTLVCVCSTVDNGDGSFRQKFKLTGTPATSGRNTSLAKAIPITGAQIGDQYECWVVCTIEKGVGLTSMAARINSRGISLGGTYTTSQNIAPGVFLLRSKLHLAETTAVTTLTPNMTLVLGTGEVDVEVSFSKPYLRKVA